VQLQEGGAAALDSFKQTAFKAISLVQLLSTVQ